MKVGGQSLHQPGEGIKYLRVDTIPGLRSLKEVMGNTRINGGGRAGMMMVQGLE